MILIIFLYILDKKSQARINSEIFVNFRPEPDPKSPAPLATLQQTINRSKCNRAAATATVECGSITGRVKPKTINIGTHSFPP